MSVARAERRRQARSSRRRPPSPHVGEPEGGTVGTLDDGREWSIRFPTATEARRFLTILGPPPATEARLHAALAILRKGNAE